MIAQSCPVKKKMLIEAHQNSFSGELPPGMRLRRVSQPSIHFPYSVQRET